MGLGIDSYIGIFFFTITLFSKSGINFLGIRVNNKQLFWNIESY